MSAAEITLDSLVGEHVLTGVDRDSESLPAWEGASYNEDCDVLRFCLDGVNYAAVENPDDGYRSSLRHLVVTEVPIKNSFAPVRVLARKKSDVSYQYNDTLELIDIANGQVILEAGTDNVGDYYPYFVAQFYPERMSLNAHVWEPQPGPAERRNP